MKQKGRKIRSEIAREEKILETIRKSREVFTLKEAEQTISYPEFILQQLQLIHKRWWLLQLLLLGVLAGGLPFMKGNLHVARNLGVIGVLFVVLIIPEFWKNKSYDCMQIEAACLYSLRQIYAARMMLFGMVDFLILTGFCFWVRGSLGPRTAEVMVQLLFPMTVAACILFGVLWSRFSVNETSAVSLCLLWSAVWCILITNEGIYAAITIPVWYVLFAGALILLGGLIYKAIQDCGRIWNCPSVK